MAEILDINNFNYGASAQRGTNWASNWVGACRYRMTAVSIGKIMDTPCDSCEVTLAQRIFLESHEL
jgi:hypothetical protein